MIMNTKSSAFSTSQRSRLWIASRLEWLFPKRFCWANLVCWSLNKKWFAELFTEENPFGRPTGCKNDPNGCYCGKFEQKI
jgi:hypothetical protein